MLCVALISLLLAADSAWHWWILGITELPQQANMRDTRSVHRFLGSANSRTANNKRPFPELASLVASRAQSGVQVTDKAALAASCLVPAGPGAPWFVLDREDAANPQLLIASGLAMQPLGWIRSRQRRNVAEQLHAWSGQVLYSIDPRTIEDVSLAAIPFATAKHMRLDSVLPMIELHRQDKEATEIEEMWPVLRIVVGSLSPSELATQAGGKGKQGALSKGPPKLRRQVSIVRGRKGEPFHLYDVSSVARVPPVGKHADPAEIERLEQAKLVVDQARQSEQDIAERTISIPLPFSGHGTPKHCMVQLRAAIGLANWGFE